MPQNNLLVPLQTLGEPVTQQKQLHEEIWHGVLDTGEMLSK